MSTRTVVVFGATGNQGSSVLKALLADGTFVPRAVTRNPNSEKALRLKGLGAEVVQADLWDVESLKKAMNGAEGVFGVTNYYDPKLLAAGHDSEVRVGQNLVDAAAASGIKFLVWSCLPNCTQATNGKYSSVYHFDNKANIADYLRSTQLPHAILYTGWFVENTPNCIALSPDKSTYYFTVPKYDPNSPQYIVWVERDVGQCVLALLKNYKDDSAHVLGESFYAVGAKMTYSEYAAVIEKILEKPVRFVTGPSSGMEELDQMFEYQSEFGMYPDVTIPDPRLERLGVKFHSMETYAQEELKKRFAQVK